MLVIIRALHCSLIVSIALLIFTKRTTFITAGSYWPLLVSVNDSICRVSILISGFIVLLVTQVSFYSFNYQV